jgi:hypothetical protein
MRGMQCNVEFVYQLSIYYRTEENHGEPSSCWPVAGAPSECVLTSSQQPGINTKTVRVIPVCVVVSKP